MSSSHTLEELLRRNTMPAAPALVELDDDKAVRCLACGHRCRILPGRAGVCRVRYNDGGQLLVPAGFVAGLQVDPIEKKPLYHAFPGRDALSFGMLGCNFHCPFCQNWISTQTLRDDHAVVHPQMVDPQQLVSLAVEHGAPAIVSTYNEPLITADWAVEVFKLARRQNLVCGFVSNGHATPQVLEFIRPYVDLYKVDLKCFDEAGYRRLGGVMQNVLDTIRLLVKLDFWVEVVTLVVPGFNDSDDELRRIADFLAGVSVDIPWHVTAFHPDYKMTDRSRTPVSTLTRARELGLAAGLHFVYLGNVAGSLGDAENTLCPDCNQLLIRRRGFHVLENHLRDGQCPNCNRAIPGVWQPGTTTEGRTGRQRFNSEAT